MAAKKKNKKTKKTKAVNNNTKIVQEITNELFSLLGTESVPEITEDKENDAVLVNIKTGSEAGLLIGNRGETLNSIQTIIGMIYRKKTGEWKRILVNVADWREKQKDRLTQLALQTAQRVKASVEPQTLYNLSPSQRRIIHIELAKDDEVETESLGENQDRYIVVAPKKKSKKSK